MSMRKVCNAEQDWIQLVIEIHQMNPCESWTYIDAQSLYCVKLLLQYFEIIAEKTTLVRESEPHISVLGGEPMYRAGLSRSACFQLDN